MLQGQLEFLKKGSDVILIEAGDLRLGIRSLQASAG